MNMIISFCLNAQLNFSIKKQVDCSLRNLSNLNIIVESWQEYKKQNMNNYYQQWSINKKQSIWQVWALETLLSLQNSPECLLWKETSGQLWQPSLFAEICEDICEHMLCVCRNSADVNDALILHTMPGRLFAHLMTRASDWLRVFF